MTEKHPIQWLTLLETKLSELNKLPPLEDRFFFPWEQSIHEIKNLLNINSFSMEGLTPQWKDAPEILTGLGSSPFLVSIELSPLQDALILAFSQSDIQSICAYLLGSSNAEGFFTPQLQEGFYHFILLKILKTFNQFDVFQNLSFALNTTALPPQHKSLCLDFICHLGQKNTVGRLICSEPLWEKFQRHYSLKEQHLSKSKVTDTIQIPLQPKLGSTVVSIKEWEKIQVGDFLLLDQCLYQGQEKKGSIILSLDGTDLLIARVKPEGLKILDYLLKTPLEFEKKSFSEKENSENLAEGEQVSTASSLMSLTIAIKPIEFSLSQVLEFTPGQLIPLELDFPNEIDILWGEQKKGSGEILKLGKVAGVKILSIAD